MDEYVAAAVALENELAGPSHVIRVAEVDDDVARAIKDDHGVVGQQASDNRPADRTRSPRYDRDTAVIIGSA
jgi:hypothetical protein